MFRRPADRTQPIVKVAVFIDLEHGASRIQAEGLVSHMAMCQSVHPLSKTQIVFVVVVLQEFLEANMSRKPKEFISIRSHDPIIVFGSFLYTANIPDPDIMIRTSGEKRVSNFLLWQLAYSELFFLDDFWPDIGKEHLQQVIDQYHKRDRRYGTR